MFGHYHLLNCAPRQLYQSQLIAGNSAIPALLIRPPGPQSHIWFGLENECICFGVIEEFFNNVGTHVPHTVLQYLNKESTGQ